MRSICSHCDCCCREFRLSACLFGRAASSMKAGAAQESDLGNFNFLDDEVVSAKQSDQAALSSQLVKILD